jgi:hypothetical protein
MTASEAGFSSERNDSNDGKSWLTPEKFNTSFGQY